MSCFFDLPNELILKVLRYTETMDIFGYFLSLNQNLQLRELDLPNCKSTSSEVLEDLLASCHSLQRLSLEGVELTPKMVARIFQNRQTCTTNLKNIDSKKLSKPDIMLLRNILGV